VNSSTPFRRLKRDVKRWYSIERKSTSPFHPTLTHTHFNAKDQYSKVELISIATDMGLVTHTQVPLFRDLNDLEEANSTKDVH
jgi:hypothetical protein